MRHTVLNKTYHNNKTVRRRIGLLAIAPVLLLCALYLAPSARAADYQYMLEVTTGVSTGDEKKVEFFIITYDGAAGSATELNSILLFPHADSLKQSCAAANAVSTEQKDRDALLYERYGYRADAAVLDDRTPFQSYQVDQYLFTTSDPIDRIDNIQIFVGSRGTWTTQGVRVFRVDRVGGLYRWNDLGNETYIDFEGELIAESCKSGRTSDKLIRMSAADSAQRAPGDLELQTSFDDAYKTHAMQHGKGHTMAIRFDFADVYGAGLECLSASRNQNTLDAMRPIEDMLLSLRYVDRYGATRTAEVPAVINSVEYARALGAETDQPLAGLAQQGESMVVGVFLPDFGSFSETSTFTLTLGGKTVREKAKLTASGIGEAREAESMQDDAALLTTAVYLFDTAEDGHVEETSVVSARVDETAGAIRYEFRDKPYAFRSSGSTGGEAEVVGANGVTLRAFRDGDILAREASASDTFLIELTTDDIPGAGTSADLLMSVAYTDLEGKQQRSGTISVRERARDFYGYWPGSRSDFGYYAGVAEGQTLRFVIALPKAKEITDVRTWIDGKAGGGDEWQMANCVISAIRSGPLKRSVSWEAVSVGGLTSDRRFDRYALADQIYEYRSGSKGPVLIQPGQEPEAVGPVVTANGQGGVDVLTRQELDWSQLRYNMSYDDASQDLGFVDSAVKYKVTVHVGNTIVSTSGNGDSGSKNLFHFRLIFEGGSSGYVLANQQLSGDGFRADQAETFTIPTNRDYGDVTAVQIVPDDISGDSDKFDKLEIDSIEITQTVNASLSPTWTVSQVGWIGIDYRDEGASESIRGQKGRSAEDLTQTYLVDGMTYSVKLMAAIQTDSYDSPTEQFRGALSADVYYDHHSTSTETGSTGDIVEAMYEYQRHGKNYSQEVGGMAVSDPNWMFRANHTDRFFFELRDVKQINRMVFHVRGTSSLNWHISGVALYLVNGPGKLRLNANGEYEQFYDAGMELTRLAYSTSEAMPYAYSQHIEKYNNNPANPNAADITVNFTENLIEVNPEAKQWTSIVSREPASRNDTLNIFLWPDAATDASAYGGVTKIVYSDLDGNPQQASTGAMDLALYNGEPVFYATNVRANNLSGISSITFYSGSGERISGIRRGLIQRVRSGVVVKSWEVGGSGLSDFGIVLGELPTTAAQEQRVLLQLGADTGRSALSPQQDDSGVKTATDDLAVALWYRSDNPNATELRTPYVYLTDQGYTEIHPGQLVELKFDQVNVSDITGISLVSSGGVQASVDAGYVVDRQIGREDGALVRVRGEYSFALPVTVSNVPNRMNPSGSVTPLTMTFLTDKSQENISGGTGDPVRMTMGYYDRYGSLHTPVYEDLRIYIEGDDAVFRADRETVVSMLVPGLDELRWIELEPYKEQRTGDSAATWNLKEVRSRIGESGSEADRSVGQLIVEGKPLRLSMADILLYADVFIGGSAEAQTMTGGSRDIQLQSGESIRVASTLRGSAEGLAVKLEGRDPITGATGNAELGDTRGYTQEFLEQKRRDAATEAEAAIWAAARVQSGSLNADDPANVTFTPPRNYTDGDLGYRLTIYSREAPAAAVTLNIVVKNETDPTKKTLEDFMQEMLRMQQQGGSGETGGTP